MPGGLPLLHAAAASGDLAEVQLLLLLRDDIIEPKMGTSDDDDDDRENDDDEDESDDDIDIDSIDNDLDSDKENDDPLLDELDEILEDKTEPMILTPFVSTKSNIPKAKNRIQANVENGPKNDKSSQTKNPSKTVSNQTTKNDNNHHPSNNDSNNNKNLMLTPDFCGHTALHWAAMGGHVDICRCLMEQALLDSRQYHENEDPNTDDDTDYEEAHDEEHDDMPCLVLLHYQDKTGKTALHYASERAHLKVVTYLVQVMQELEEQQLAHTPKPVTSTIQIYEHDHDSSHHDDNSHNCSHDDLEILVDDDDNDEIDLHNNLLHRFDHDGNTALHLAAAADHLEIVQYLLEDAGASLTLPNHYGQRVIDVATRQQPELHYSERHPSHYHHHAFSRVARYLRQRPKRLRQDLEHEAQTWLTEAQARHATGGCGTRAALDQRLGQLEAQRHALAGAVTTAQLQQRRALEEQLARLTSAQICLPSAAQLRSWQDRLQSMIVDECHHDTAQAIRLAECLESILLPRLQREEEEELEQQHDNGMDTAMTPTPPETKMTTATIVTPEKDNDNEKRDEAIDAPTCQFDMLCL